MRDVTLEPISNRADWTGTLEFVNDDTGELITDLSGVTARLEVRGHTRYGDGLVATTENGKFRDIGNGVMSWAFSREEMAGFCAGSYEIGITIKRNGITEQELIGILPIVDGVVSR